MKTEFKRVQEEIETLKYSESHKELTEHGKQKLIELETLMDYAHSCAQLNAIFKKGDIIIYKNDLQGQVIEELKNNKVEIKINGYGILKVHKKHLELIPRSI